MTYKMLIVDDEPIIPKGLESTIPWEEYDVEVLGIAYDGEEAIEKVKEFKGIDIVITDVRMPKKDGIQLASYLSKNHPRTKIVIISGYDEFKYAQQALQLGVKDYLLKPVDIEELLEVITKITKEIADEKVDSHYLLQSTFVNAIYHQVFDYPIEKTKELEEMEMMQIFPFFSMVKNYSDQTSEIDTDTFKANFKKTLDNYFDSLQWTYVSTFVSDNLLLTCVLDNNISTEEITSISQQIDFQPLIFMCKDYYVQLSDLGEVTQNWIEKMNYLPILKETKLFIPKEDMEQAKVTYPKEQEEKLVDSIVQFDQEKLSEQTTNLINYLKKNECLLGESVTICKTILIKAINRLRDLLQKDTVYIVLQLDQQLDVLVVDSYEQLQVLFSNDINNIISEFNLKDVDDKDWLMERAIDYIRSYYKSEIKAQEVANVINISPTYFSSLFKQKTGKNFNEYVNHLRVEEAKKLLVETPFKVVEISEQVGFQEYKYFVEVFKKFSGLTPTKYRKLTSINH